MGLLRGIISALVGGGGAAAAPGSRSRDAGPPRLDPRQVAVLPPRPDGWPVLPSDAADALPGPPAAQREYASTACPWCSVEMAPPPRARKRCRSCGNYVAVRSGPDDLRHLLRADEVDTVLARWAEEAARRNEERTRRRLGVLRQLGMPVDDEDDGATVDVVGESYHLPELVALVARYPARECVAMLRREPGNPYDPQAVEVLVDGVQVGHLGREDAREYQPRLRSWEKRGRVMWAVAELRGGGLGPDGLHWPVGVELSGLPVIGG